MKPEGIYEDLNLLELDPTQELRIEDINCDTQLVTVKDGVNLPPITAFRLLVAQRNKLGRRNPILLKDCLAFEKSVLEPKIALLRAADAIFAVIFSDVGWS